MPRSVVIVFLILCLLAGSSTREVQPAPAVVQYYDIHLEGSANDK